MKKLIDIMSEELKTAFEKAGYSTERIAVTESNRPDLCEYQCNGAMALAKAAHKAPLAIAEEAAAQLAGSAIFSKVDVVKPGFINLDLADDYLRGYVNEMAATERFGLGLPGKGKKVIIDYGGPNVAKPLHIGHLRSAIIGESIKRICKYMGCDAIGDVHLGDWGLQMGQIIAELHARSPQLPYFDEAFAGEYPKEAPFTISELEEIYPCASKKCKEDSPTYDPAFYEEAKEATAQLQQGRRGYRAIWRHVLDVSVADLKQNYEKLDVHFELWKGESDAQRYIPGMIAEMREKGFLHESEGALVVDVNEETDKKEIPPCIIVKSDGATLYSTTDLATIVQRMEDYDPDHIIYVVDKRQNLHFVQVFRTARKTGLVGEGTELSFLGFGTMNGKDGQPYKTRQGGVMRLETLIDETREAVLEKMSANAEIPEQEREETAKIIALSALKYGDLSNQATKDYIFDINRFIEFEGNTGPYILYTIVRMKSILGKCGLPTQHEICDIYKPVQKDLMRQVSKFSRVMEEAYEELAPHKICAYIHELSNAFNSLYHEMRIVSCEDPAQKDSCINLLMLTKSILETCIGLLGFQSPDRM